MVSITASLGVTADDQDFSSNVVLEGIAFEGRETVKNIHSLGVNLKHMDPPLKALKKTLLTTGPYQARRQGWRWGFARTPFWPSYTA